MKVLILSRVEAFLVRDTLSNELLAWIPPRDA